MQAFPRKMQEDYAEEIKQHPLRREIIATQLSNHLVNEMGFSFTFRLLDETGAPIPVIVRSYFVIRELFQLNKIWKQVESLDNKVPSETQHDMFFKYIRLCRRSTRWLLKNYRMHMDVSDTLNTFSDKFDELISVIGECVSGEVETQCQQITQSFINKGVERDIAEQFGLIPALMSAFDIVIASNDSNYSIKEIAKSYFLISNRLNIGWLRQQVIAHSVDSNWDAMTREGLRDDLDWQQRLLTVGILDFYHGQQTNIDDLVVWVEKYRTLVERWERIITELKALSHIDFAMFFVAIRELLDLTQTCSQRDILQRDAS